MTRNEFIHRAIIAQMANPYAWGRDNNPFRMSYSDIIDAADDMADYVEGSGIHFDALPIEEAGERRDPRPDTKEERLEALKARREELLKEMCDILDKNSVTNPSQLPKEEMLNYFDANCELRYIRDQIDAVYKTTTNNERHEPRKTSL